MRRVEAAGAVVLRGSGEAAEVLAVHRPRYDDWSLPKGKLQPGEVTPATAVREVAEESGLRIRLQSPLDQVSYRTARPADKTVSWWRGTPMGCVESGTGPGRENGNGRPEVDDIAWLSVGDALERLDYDQDHELVEQAIEQPVTTPLIVVRHAKAINRDDWRGTDPERPLRPRGRTQARRLVPLLAAYGVGELYTSPWLRCTATLQPYALQARLSSTAWAILNEEEGSDDPGGVAAAMDELRERAVVERRPIAVCGHRPVLPHMLTALDVPERQLATAECLVVHLTDTGDVHAVEYHRPRA